MANVSIRDLRNKGGEVVDRAARGEAITITKAGKPVAELHPVSRRGLSADVLRRSGRASVALRSPPGGEWRHRKAEHRTAARHPLHTGPNTGFCSTCSATPPSFTTQHPTATPHQLTAADLSSRASQRRAITGRDDGLT
jgi:prevent-host-death family protein